MIAACPKCSARYRIDVTRLRPEGARLRCSRCEAVFRVRPPAQAPAPAPAEPSREAPVPPVASAEAPAPPVASAETPVPPVAATETPVPPVASAETPAPLAAQAPFEPPGAEATTRSEAARSGLVLVADPGVESGKATASALASWGLDPVLVHDGVEAMLTIQRTLPRVVVIDAALPKMFGFQVCEMVKRNESLRHIQVVLVGAIHDRERYRRSPTELYGADAYVERPQIPDALRPILVTFGLSTSGESAAGAAPEPLAIEPPVAPPIFEPLPEAEPPVAPPALVEAAPPPSVVAETIEPLPPEPPTPPRVVEVTPPAPEPPPSVPAAAEASSPEIEDAERLARIVVSDIVLYNQEKFEAAVAAGNVLEAMEPQIREGRELLAERVDAALREARDFVTDEILRVAKQRGGV